MGRIRSVHPGLFTDESYMSLSMTARAALPGLWTECDDAGVFEWKPLVLKAKIFPADNLNMNDVLSEIAAAGCIMRIEVDGKGYGLVRNFRKYQRPEKPKYRHPLPDEFRSYVGLSPISPQPVADQSATIPGNPPQREEEGGRMDKKDEGEREDARAQEPEGHREKADAILKDKSFQITSWEDGFLSNVAQLDRLTAEQKAQFKAIADRWKGKQANAPPVKPQFYAASGSPELAAWDRHLRATIGRDAPRDSKGGWWFDSKIPASTDREKAA